MRSVHVVIPSFGLDPMLRQCLAALCAAGRRGGAELSVTVVDNASPFPYDRSVIPDGLDVEILRLDAPHGFAAACNLGARRRDSDRILFLNNDVLCHDEVLVDVDAAMEALGASIGGTRLVRSDGTIQHCGIRFDGGDRGPYHWMNHAPSRTVPRRAERFQAVTGAFLMIDRAVFERLGGFDELFPFAYEDVDLCLRAGGAGEFVVCAQGTESIHLHGASRNDWSAARERESRRVFFARWGGRFTIDGDEEDP